jgi:hypothetical protein
MRRGRLAFDAADQRYSNSRLSLIVAARWQEDDGRFLRGQVMKGSKGQANPQVVNEVW